MTLIAGDYDMNLLKKIISDKRLVIFDFMLANSFFPKIILHTILDRSTRTLIANTYFKLSPLFIDAILGIICSKMSDHFPYFLSLKLQVISKSPKITDQHTAGSSVSQLSQLAKLSPWLTLSTKDITTSFCHYNERFCFYLIKSWVYIISLTQ